MTTVTFSGTGPLTQAIVTAGIGSATIVIIQDYTSIGINAFQLEQQITSVTIGDSVTSIGTTAFIQCTSLTSVTLGNSVTSIGEYALSACTKLSSVTIPNSVISIGTSAFQYSGLTTVSMTKQTADTLGIILPSENVDFYGAYPVTTIVIKVPPTITFPNITATYGDPSRQIIYSSTSNGAVTFTSSNTSVATISEDMITFVSSGTSTITATQQASIYYTSATTPAECTVEENTPDNPVKLPDGAAVNNFMGSNATSGALVSEEPDSVTFVVAALLAAIQKLLLLYNKNIKLLKDKAKK